MRCRVSVRRRHHPPSCVRSIPRSPHDLDELQESELTPTGSNLLDGRFAVFGYVVDSADLLGELQVTDATLWAQPCRCISQHSRHGRTGLHQLIGLATPSSACRAA